MPNIIVALCCIAMFWCTNNQAQQTNITLKSGFNSNEYKAMLALQFFGFSNTDSLINASNQYYNGPYKKVLITPEVGLYNKGAIYLNNAGQIIVQLRGTVNQMNSWLENFYAGMVPANGSIQLDDNYTFNYNLAQNDNASVHVGWLLGTGYLMREMLPTIDSLVQAGYTQIIVSGHSQGGALSFLVSSYLHYYFKDAKRPVILKTYASAAPKPGNQYYAYDFDYILGNNMGFRIVNSEDWVPESPFSIQTLTSFNEANPFTNAKTTIKKQKLATRIVMKHVYNKLDNSTLKAQKTFTKYLGKKVGGIVHKQLPAYVMPKYVPDFNYATAGTPIILMANQAYKSKFVFDGANVFVHHSKQAYEFLIDAIYGQ